MKTRCVGLRDFWPSDESTNAFNLLTGMETLHLRMERHVENAHKVATYLAQHPAVSWVLMRGLQITRITIWLRKYFPKGPCGSRPLLRPRPHRRGSARRTPQGLPIAGPLIFIWPQISPPEA